MDSISTGFYKAAKRFFVYRNLHKGTGPGNYVYSMRAKDTGRVEDRKSNFILKDVKFRVGEKGRQRVISEGRKNVHAGVDGEPAKAPKGIQWQRVLYNPKTQSHFTDEKGKKLFSADYVKFTRDGIFSPK